MAYNDDSVRAKLSALNETQEGIVTVAQWVMFHRRHADRTVQLWFQKLRDSTANKRLNLIYLANEVAQQSKARRKEDFIIAFSPIIAEATAVAYKGASSDIQQKIRRVVEVWRQRGVFELPIQEAVEARVNELDKNRSSGKKTMMGGSLFGSSYVPPEFQPLIQLQANISKHAMTSGMQVNTTNADFDKMIDPNTEKPPAPVLAARLSQLSKAIADTENTISEIIKSRQTLMEGLEKMLESNREAISKETALLTQIGERKAQVEMRKREVEDAIMRGLSAEESMTPADDAGGLEEPARPTVEALTPPPIESLTPTGSPSRQALEDSETKRSQSHPFTLSEDHQMDWSSGGQSLENTPGDESRNGFDS